MRRFVALVAVVVVFASGMSFAGEEPQIPKELIEQYQFYAGEWSVEGSEGDAPIKGTASFRMPAGNHCILGTESVRVGNERTTCSFVTGWDSSTGWDTEQGVGSDGSVYRLEWRRVSPTVDEGTLVGTLNGKKVTGKARTERKGENEVVFVMSERKMGDESLPDLRIVYRRVAKEKGKGKAKK
jgi:hypothetical protein